MGQEDWDSLSQLHQLAGPPGRRAGGGLESILHHEGDPRGDEVPPCSHQAEAISGGQSGCVLTQHVTMRLAWILQHCAEVRRAVREGTCCFGTIDTWLLYKLSKGAVHATDYSNASTTGIFDSYQMCWSEFLCQVVSLPLSIFPTVENTGHNYGSSDASIFGVPIPIMSVMADQQAAMFGECCFDTGDVKITMGTGTFMDINTGNKPHTSVAGLYPLVGWKIGPEVVYLAEGNAADTGTAIKWAQKLDLFSDVQETEAMASSVKDSDGVCFVPSFSGLQAPLNDPKACASFMGLKPSTTKSHLVRAILESVAFRNKQLYDIMLRETHIPITRIRADGGVCTNDFIMQLTADLLGKKIDRPSHFDMSSLGAAFVAGLAVGFWKNQEELKRLRTTDRMFLPNPIRASTGPSCRTGRTLCSALFTGTASPDSSTQAGGALH
ncbi:hypothetical protein AGOR_G00237220 [Albula goreensis]|uniref:glycerol kinase n=1 Tax=Albula goreensis TaxID=1534307 RepID=A0A8T3CHX7_9TELE|nr:hypothetical protein AGOR_G00237220 [Albula goreensis]